MLRDLIYTGGALDRAADRRTDAAWVAACRAAPTTRVLPVWRERNLFVLGESPASVALSGDAARAALDVAEVSALLGVDSDGVAWFAAGIGIGIGIGIGDDGDRPAYDGVDGTRYADLRRFGAILPAAEASALAYARGMVHWHRRHRHCGTCGSPTLDAEGGHLRVCAAAGCGAQHFPRTDPAVIMLVTRPGPAGGACLLARQSRWPKGMMSTLAGFVEPGENLEEAVIREVAEETDVRVGAVRYRGSQPWPFPSSLMIGFRAEADPEAQIVFDHQELETAGWFTRAELEGFEDRGLFLPRADSIARRLVDEWIAEG